jgi:hypothetical protein
MARSAPGSYCFGSEPGRQSTGLNILMCSSKQAMREALPDEVILDSSDGLTWPTLPENISISAGWGMNFCKDFG